MLLFQVNIIVNIRQFYVIQNTLCNIYERNYEIFW